jgi:hypothetical protein
VVAMAEPCTGDVPAMWGVVSVCGSVGASGLYVSQSDGIEYREEVILYRERGRKAVPAKARAPADNNGTPSQSPTFDFFALYRIYNTLYAFIHYL